MLLGIDIAALQEAEAAGLVAVADGHIEFRHPLVRSAVHSAAEPAERRAVHAALAQTLTDERDADERAWHLGAAAFGPDDGAADALARAAERARVRGAYAVAAMTAERAARLTADDGARGRRLLEAASNAWIAGSGEHTVSLLDEAEPLARDDEVRVGIATLRGYVTLARGDAMRARQVFLAAAQLVAHDPRRAALLWAEAAFASLCAGQVKSMVDDARAACAALPAHDEGIEACAAHIALGMALVLAGAGNEGPSTLRAAVTMAGYEGLCDGPPLLGRWARRSAALPARGAHGARVARARSHLRARSRPGGGAPDHCFTSSRGTPPRPIAGPRLARATTKPWSWRITPASRATSAWPSPGSRGSMRAKGGRRAAARTPPPRSHSRASTVAAPSRPGRSRPSATSSSRSGDRQEAIERLADVTATLERLGIADVDLQPAPELVEALVQCGRSDEAATAAAAYRGQAAAKGQPWALARAARADGLVAGDAAFAELFDEALRWHEATPDTFERARSELAYGERLRRVRRRGDARLHLRNAFTAFHQLGAASWAERARLELAATGETTRKRDPSTLDQLTPRELQVALDLASGLTTREAASKLYLSPKTIEFHLRSVYRKLGIAIARRAGDGPEPSGSRLTPLGESGDARERRHEPLAEGRQRRSVLGAVLGVQLGDRERAHPRVAQYFREGRERIVLAETGIAPGVLRQRRVREVDAVDVEVHGQAVAGCEGRERRACGRDRIGRDVGPRDPRESPLLDQLQLVRRAVQRVVGEQHDLIVREQRRAGPELTQLARRARIAEHVRDAHPVERAVRLAVGRVEVAVDVEVDEPDPSRIGQMPGHRADADGAVAAQHERHLAGGKRVAHALGGVARAGHDGRQVLCVGLRRGRAASATPERRRGRRSRCRHPRAGRAGRPRGVRRGAFSCPGA